MSQTTPSISRSAYLGGLCLIALVAVGVRVHLIGQPLDRDEGFYAYMAQRMLAGEVPYRDVFCDKPPVAFLIYAGFCALLGQTAKAIHFGGALWVAASSVLMAGLARRLYGASAGLAAGLIYAITCAESTYQGSSINLELLLTPFVLLALQLIVSEQLTMPRVAWSGLLLGVALLTKQQAIGHAAFAALWLLIAWWYSSGRPILVLLVRPVVMASAALAVFAASLAIFFWYYAWEEYIDGLLLWNLRTYVPHERSERAWGNFWSSVWPILTNNPVFHLLAVVGLIGSVRESSAIRWFAPLWFLLNLGAVSIGLRFYKHYFLFTHVALVLLAAYAVGRTISDWAWRGHRWRRGLVGLLVAVAIASPLIIQNGYFFRWTAWRHVRELYGPELFAEAERLAGLIARNTHPQEQVFIFGSEPQIYFLAQRRGATRYAFAPPLTAPGGRSLERQQEVIEELRRTNPPLLIIVDIPMSHLLQPESPRLIWDVLVRMRQQFYDGVLTAYLREDHAEYRAGSRERPLQPEEYELADVLVLKRRDRRLVGPVP